MSAYEEEKDVLVEDLGAIGDTGLLAEVRCYDGGLEKLSVRRPVGKKGKVRQVFRIPLNEARELGKFIMDIKEAEVSSGDNP